MHARLPSTAAIAVSRNAATATDKRLFGIMLIVKVLYLWILHYRLASYNASSASQVHVVGCR